MDTREQQLGVQERFESMLAARIGQLSTDALDDDRRVGKFEALLEAADMLNFVLNGEAFIPRSTLSSVHLDTLSKDKLGSSFLDFVSRNRRMFGMKDIISNVPEQVRHRVFRTGENQ